MAKRDRWPELMQLAAVDDGLPTRECGSWTADKLYFWSKYIDITTTAMVGNPKWRTGLVYVDLFAGPGICKVRDSGVRLPGSAFIAAHAPKPFSKIIAVELEQELAEGLRSRLGRSPAAQRCTVLQGDCNQLVGQIVRSIPSGALTLAFIDPPGFDAQFDTLKTLADGARVDFLLLFADSIDLVRNLRQYVDTERSKVDRMLGSSDWRGPFEAIPSFSPARVREFFVEQYVKRVQEDLGYRGVRTYQIEGPSGPLYKLIYASKSEKGLDFWDKIAARDRGGQGSLPF